MAYDNLTNVTTSTSGTWVGTPFSYSSIALESGIPHKDQLEVERIFTLPSSPTNVAAGISLYDLHRIFVINKNEYAVNETTSTITAMTVASTPRNYVTQVATPTVPAGTSVAIPVSTNNDAIVIRRKTFSSGKYVTWSAGTRLTSEQLNLQVNQLIKINQELIYKLESEYLRGTDVTGSSAPAFGVNNNLDMQGHQIVNLSDPSSPNDAVNINYANANYVRVSGAAAQTITGAKTFSGAALFQNTVTADSTLLVTGMTTLNGGLTMDGGVFTVADITGNTSISGTLNAGATTLASASVTGALTVDTTTLVVDASNNRVGIGTATPTVNLQVVASATPTIVSEATANTGVSQIRSVSDGASIDIRSYGTSATGALIAGLNRADMTALYATSPTNFAIVTPDSIPISLATNNTTRITIPSNASGIQFPSSPTLSANVNTLDAYLEGEHTIQNTDFQGETIAGTHTLGEKTITYTRIGNRLFFNLELSTTACSVTGSGHARIINLPFNLNETWFTIDYYSNLISSVVTLSAQWSGTVIRFYSSTVAATGISDHVIEDFRKTGTSAEQTFTIRASGSGTIA